MTSWFAWPYSQIKPQAAEPMNDSPAVAVAAAPPQRPLYANLMEAAGAGIMPAANAPRVQALFTASAAADTAAMQLVKPPASRLDTKSNPKDRILKATPFSHTSRIAYAGPEQNKKTGSEKREERELAEIAETAARLLGESFRDVRADEGCVIA